MEDLAYNGCHNTDELCDHCGTGEIEGSPMSLLSTTKLVEAQDKLAQPWINKAEDAHNNQQLYQEKLEQAAPSDVFRYVYLINNAAVQQYVNQSRGQAEASFILSRRAAIAGFILLVLSIVIGIVADFTGHSLNVAFLGGLGGAITQFVSGVFFWLYNRTLQQIHLFYQGMLSQQTEALAEISRVSDSAREAENGPLPAPTVPAEVEDAAAESEPA